MIFRLSKNKFIFLIKNLQKNSLKMLCWKFRKQILIIFFAFSKKIINFSIRQKKNNKNTVCIIENDCNILKIEYFFIIKSFIHLNNNFFDLHFFYQCFKLSQRRHFFSQKNELWQFYKFFYRLNWYNWWSISQNIFRFDKFETSIYDSKIWKNYRRHFEYVDDDYRLFKFFDEKHQSKWNYSNYS